MINVLCPIFFILFGLFKSTNRKLEYLLIRTSFLLIISYSLILWSSLVTNTESSTQTITLPFISFPYLQSFMKLSFYQQKYELMFMLSSFFIILITFLLFSNNGYEKFKKAQTEIGIYWFLFNLIILADDLVTKFIFLLIIYPLIAIKNYSNKNLSLKNVHKALKLDYFFIALALCFLPLQNLAGCPFYNELIFCIALFGVILFYLSFMIASKSEKHQSVAFTSHLINFAKYLFISTSLIIGWKNHIIQAKLEHFFDLGLLTICFFAGMLSASLVREYQPKKMILKVFFIMWLLGHAFLFLNLEKVYFLYIQAIFLMHTVLLALNYEIEINTGNIKDIRLIGGLMSFLPKIKELLYVYISFMSMIGVVILFLGFHSLTNMKSCFFMFICALYFYFSVFYLFKFYKKIFSGNTNIGDEIGAYFKDINIKIQLLLAIILMFLISSFIARLVTLNYEPNNALEINISHQIILSIFGIAAGFVFKSKKIRLGKLLLLKRPIAKLHKGLARRSLTLSNVFFNAQNKTKLLKIQHSIVLKIERSLLLNTKLFIVYMIIIIYIAYRFNGWKL